MKIFRNASIKHKQMFSIMLTTSVALLLGCAAFATYEVLTFRKTMLRHITTMAEIIGDNSAGALDFNDPKGAEETLAALKAEPNIVGACIYTKDGQVFAEYDRSGDKRGFMPPPFQMNGHSFGKQDLGLFEPINYKGETIGVVFIASDMKALYARLEQYRMIAAGVFSVTLLVAFVLSAWLQRLISEPILELVETAGTVARDRNYSLRAVKQSEDELGALIDGFNEMLRQIQQRDGELQAARNNLEQRVEERTAELQHENAERKRAEAELVESQALYHSLVEHLPAGVFRKDGAGRFVFVNSWYCRLKGMFAEQILGKNPNELAAFELSGEPSPETKWQAKLALQGAGHHEQIMSNGQHVELVEEHTGTDGKLRYVRVVKLPVYDANGGIVGSQGMLFDFTERKRAEEQLQASLKELSEQTALMEAMVNSSLDGILVVNDQGKMIVQNLQFNRLLEIPQDIIEQTEDSRRLQYVTDSAKDPAKFLQKVRHLYQHRDETSREEIEFKSGKVMDRYSSPVLDRHGNYYGRIWTFRDITEQKRMQQDVEEAHKQLLDISRQAGMAEVATSVLHNVGNVLNSVNISNSVVSEKVRKSKAGNLAKVAALLQANKDDLVALFAPGGKGQQLPDYLSGLAKRLVDDQEEILAELASLNGNIEHIKEIVSMQQSYARVSGVVDEHKVEDLIEDALRMNAGAMDRHQVKVIREFNPTPKVLVDKHKVLQILVNLIRNAKYALDDAMPPEKRMTLHVAVNGNQRVKISVIDNGIGIPAENLTRIFGHGFTTRKEGHGFGLHSGALTAKELGGSLTAHSDGPGQGARFTLEIPSVPDAETSTKI